MKQIPNEGLLNLQDIRKRELDFNQINITNTYNEESYEDDFLLNNKKRKLHELKFAFQ